MSVLNLLMLNLLIEVISTNKTLNFKLKALLNKGFVYRDDCYFLSAFLENQLHLKKEDFIDSIGFECFINSFHVDDYVEEDLFIQSMLFIDLLIKEWEKSDIEKNLTIILSKTDFGFNIKFHTKRNEVWIDVDNLNDFEEGIMVITTKKT